MAKTVEFPIRMSPVVYWSGEFDNSPRHCWPDKDGIYHVDGKWDKLCNRKHNSKTSGKVEWMRFIHMVNSIIKDTFNPWNEDTDYSTIGGFGEPKQLCRDMHDSEGNHWPAAEVYPNWIVYLDNHNGKAKIELHNEDLIWIANKTYDEVQASYGR